MTESLENTKSKMINNVLNHREETEEWTILIKETGMLRRAMWWDPESETG